MLDHYSQQLLLLNNPVVWAILLDGIVCHSFLIRFCFFERHDQRWFDLTQFWLTGIKQMLTALPLLGLLGTITGLMHTFITMSKGGGVALQELISGGLGDALFTTQLGLVLVVPGLVLVGFLHHQRRNWLIKVAHEVID